MPKRLTAAIQNLILEKSLIHKIVRVLMKDLAWMALFLLVIRSQLADRLTVRAGFYVAALFLALYSIFQLVLCGKAYLVSYRDTIRRIAE
jgi:hypothetical protein